MKKIYTYLALVGVMATASTVWAQALTWGRGEVITQLIDETQSNAVADLIETEEDLVEKTLDALKKGYDSASVEKSLKGDGGLTEPSQAVTGGCEGLSNIMGKGSTYGQIKVKKCGANIPSVVDRINETLVLPAKQSDRDDLTTMQQSEREKNRKTSIESAGISTLAKAWLAETEVSSVAESISNAADELGAKKDEDESEESEEKDKKKAKSQMAVLVTILRLQEETQKSVNTRLSLMGDELVSTGLTALDSGL